MQKRFEITGTGTGDPIELQGDERLTFASTGSGGTDYALDVEVKLTRDGSWRSAQTLIDGTIYATVSGCREVRYNCTSLGSASSIELEVTSQPHV